MSWRIDVQHTDSGRRSGDGRVRTVTCCSFSPPTPSGPGVTHRHSYSVSASRAKTFPVNIRGVQCSKNSRDRQTFSSPIRSNGKVSRQENGVFSSILDRYCVVSLDPPFKSQTVQRRRLNRKRLGGDRLICQVIPHQPEANQTERVVIHGMCMFFQHP